VIQDRIAKRYAQSLFQIGKDITGQDALLADMQAIDKLNTGSRDFAAFLASPILSAKRKEEVLTTLLQKTVSTGTLSLTQLLARRRREGLLPLIAKEYIALYNKSRNITNVVLRTSVDPEPAFVHAVTKAVEQHLKTRADLKVEVKPELIGGFVLIINDRIVDASVLSALRELRKQFQQNMYVSQL